jgi:hypothetical protein
MTADHTSRTTQQQLPATEGDHDNSAEPAPTIQPPADHDDNAAHHSPDDGDAVVPETRHPTTSQISAESAAYWAPIVAAMPPMTADDLADVAGILRRIDTRRRHTGDSGES